jgi:eukaryotic-like serine/threonine-protein kinase
MIAVGTRLGPYEILSQLGAGGMGEVYRAKDTRLNRTVAIKVLPSEQIADPERKRRFVQEAKAASALNHPNIVTIYDINTDDGVDFIAMEYVAGKTLDQIIPRKGLRLGEALKYAIQMADALARAHAAGIVHRDLKPANVMVTEEGSVKMLDFGLAKLLEPGESDQWAETRDTKRDEGPITEEGTILGTVAYMSREQAEGKRVDARSDIFSFGAVLYEMVTGQRAFQGDSKMSTLAAILKEEPKAVSQMAAGIPHELERIIYRCLRKERERRLQHMDDLKVALQEVKEESDSGTLAAAPAAQKSQLRRLIWVAALLALLGAITVAVWFKHSPVKSPQTPLTAVPLTSYPGLEHSPSFSPDGNQVAFCWDGDKQGNLDIYVKLIGTAGEFRLTDHPSPERSPAWSPDGRWIAFLRELSQDQGSVVLKSPIGGPERELAEIRVRDLAWYVDLAWSPDGKWLAVPDRASPEQPTALFLVSTDSGEKRKLTSPPSTSVGDGSPAFSADGRRLAFSRHFSPFVSELYLLPLSGDLTAEGEPKPLTFEKRRSLSPVWSPDGRDLIFISGSQHHPRLWRMAASGAGVPEPLPFAGMSVYAPTISRQGRRLAYAQYVGDVNIWRVEIPGPHGKVSPPMKLISSTLLDHLPQFSPDGKRIAFQSYRSGSPEIWVCDSDGSAASQLTQFGGPETKHPRWSPDGKRLVFDSRPEGTGAIYVIGAQGGRPQRLTHDPAEEGAASWSRDGKWIYFASNRTGEEQVWKMPANGGEAVRVSREGGFSPFESPDGRAVYYIKADKEVTSLWKVPVDGGQESQVLGSIWAHNFAVVNRGIYFIPGPDRVGRFFI